MTSNLSKMRAAHKAAVVTAAPTQAAAAPVKVQSASAHKAVTDVFPNADEPMKITLANTLHAIFTRALNNQSEYTPFPTTPEGATSYPKYVIDTLRKAGARMPTTSEGDSSYRPRHEVTITAMSELSHISKSSLSSVNAGRQQLTVRDLEAWRIALSKMGAANPDNAGVAPLEELEVPEEFLGYLLKDWTNLDSTLQLSRIKEWALEYSGLSQEQIDHKVEQARPTEAGYLRSIVKVWREEYEQGKMPNYLGANTLLDIFNTRTAGRRLGRGFNVMVSAVHEGMIQFNQRTKYPKTSFALYKARYNSDHTETGLSAEVLMGYCLFLGINPIAVLQWIAVKESKTPGNWTADRSTDVNGIINWQGAISPRECLRFYAAIQHMGLVSDQNLWSLYLLHPSFIYKYIPTEEAIRDALGSDMLMSALVDEYVANSPTEPVSVHGWEKCDHPTLFGKAHSEGLALNAFSIPFSLTLAAYGEAAAKPHMKEEKTAALDAITDEVEFLAKARSVVTNVGSSSKGYATAVMVDGEIDPTESYKNTALTRQAPFASFFYVQLLAEFPAKSDI